MRYFLLTTSALILLFIDGTLTYDIFDPKTWSVFDVLILITALALWGALAWGAKSDNQNHIPK